jgi:signal transduction histidine kinase
VKHGAHNGPIRVLTTTHERSFGLTVANEAEAIGPAVRRQLFQPFFRGNRRSNPGLGLDLYIASEIERAHGGDIDVASSKEEPGFCCAFPAPDVPEAISPFILTPEGRSSAARSVDLCGVSRWNA